MPGFTLNDVLSLPDSAPAWKWIVRMPIVAGAYLSSLYVEEISLPFNNTSSDGRYTGGSKTYYPSMTDISAVTITFYEDVNYTSMNYLLNWRALVVNPNTYFYGLPSVYKQPIEWELYNGVSGIPVMAGVLLGCWPTEISPFQLQFGSSDRIKISHTFSVDASRVMVTSLQGLATNIGLDVASALLGGLPSTSTAVNAVSSLF